MKNRTEEIQDKIKALFEDKKKSISIFSKVGVLMLLSVWFSGLTKSAFDIIFIIFVMTAIAVLLFIILPFKFHT